MKKVEKEVDLEEKEDVMEREERREGKGIEKE